MEDHRIIKVNSGAFKHLIFLDICIESFLRDVDLFCTDEDMTEDAKAVYREKRKELIANLPYRTTFALNPGDMNARRIEYKGKFLEIFPSPTGLPTLRDLDILLYCESWIGNAPIEDRDNDIYRVFQFEVEDFLEFSGRSMGGDRDDRLIQALDRLAGSKITTNTIPFGQNYNTSFSYIPKYRLERDASGKIKTVTLKITYRIFYLIQNDIFDYYHPDFLRLSPIRRAIYMVVMCHKEELFSPATLSIATLHQMTGATSPLRKFKQTLRDLMDNPIPGHSFEINEAYETVTFTQLRDADVEAKYVG